MYFMNNKPKIAIVISSTRPGRICKEISQWVMGVMERDERLDLSFIDLLEINLPFLDEPTMPALGQYQHEHTKVWSALVKSYDGFVFVLPQYNWGYPAPLKNALDYLYVEWADKPASIVTYGNHGGGKAALQLQGVLQGLHMRNTSTNLALSFNNEMLREDGAFKDIGSDFASYEKPSLELSAELYTILKNA
jgi:NAD(P)H-dependent FMN reductase